MNALISSPILYRSLRLFGTVLLILALLLSAVPPQLLAAPSIPAQTDGLVLWYKFDEAANSTTFADSSSSGANGNCAGATCPTTGAPGRIGQAVQFDGADDRISAALNSPTGAFTFAAWVNHNNATWDNWRTIIEFGDDAPWFGVTESGQLTLYPIATGGRIPTQQWAHVAVTRDGAAILLYVNGQQVATSQEAPSTTGQGLLIGFENGFTSPWLGSLDDVRVYNRALSAAEIGQLNKPESNDPIVVPEDPPTEPTNPTNPVPNENSRLIDLTMSLYKPATTDAERQPYNAILTSFADAVFEMSNGAHKLRTITIYDNGRFSDRTDIRWIESKSNPSATVNGYPGGTLYMADTLFGDWRITDQNLLGRFVPSMAHEFGHYFYGQFDEYAGSATSGSPSSPIASDTPPQPCSVMCAANGELSFANLNFSTPKSTKDAGRTATANYRVFQSSGWETVARHPNDDPQGVRGKRLYYPELAPLAPGAGQDASVELPAQQAQARSALNIVWADANATVQKHRIFLLNVSANMGQNNKLNSAKTALKNYVDRARVGDKIGIYTFADTHSEVQPLITIEGDATKTAIKQVIDGITVQAGANGRNIDAANAAATAALQQAGNNAIIFDRGIFVIIDGGFTDNTNPHIFQKMYNDHHASKIPFSVFNYASAPKAGEFGNVVDMMSFTTQAQTTPRGVYRYVGDGSGFTIDGVQSAAVAQSDVRAGALIDALQDIDQEKSPILDVNLGADYGLLHQSEVYTTFIYVDATLDELEVLVEYDGASEDAQTLLFDPDGNLVEDYFCDTDEIGNYCYYYVFEPAVGSWELQLFSEVDDLEISYEAVGYALDGFTYQALLTVQGGDYVSYPADVVLVASLAEVDRIAKATVTGWLEKPDGEYIELLLADDGVAPDELADDGLYSGLMPYDQPGDYYATIVFDNIDGEAVFTEIGQTDIAEPQLRPVPDDFDRFASVAVYVANYLSDDHGEGDEATDLLADNSNRAGRIDQTGDVDSFRATSPQPLAGDPKAAGVSAAVMNSRLKAAPTRYVLRLSNLAFGMNAEVQVTTPSGTQTYETGALGYNEYWIVPVDLQPGESVQVEVTNKDGSAGGSYSISFGSPLLGENVGQPDTPANPIIYLPVVRR